MENIGPAFLDFLPALNQVPPRVDAYHPVLVPPRRFHFLEVEGLQGLIKCLVRREDFLLIGLERSRRGHCAGPASAQGRGRGALLCTACPACSKRFAERRARRDLSSLVARLVPSHDSGQRSADEKDLQDVSNQERIKPQKPRLAIRNGEERAQPKRSGGEDQDVG